MLTFYISSIIIFMIIIYCECFIYEQKIKENGWLYDNTSKPNKFVTLFCLSAIPFFRVLVVIVILCLGTYTKEDYEKYRKKLEDEMEKYKDE